MRFPILALLLLSCAAAPKAPPGYKVSFIDLEENNPEASSTDAYVCIQQRTRELDCITLDLFLKLGKEREVRHERPTSDL